MTAAQVFYLLGMLPFQLQELNERLLSQCKTWSYNENMNNVADIWLRGRYIDKMPMYSRLGEIIFILKESNVQSMNTVSRRIMPLHKIWSPLQGLSHPIDHDFKTSPPLCSSKSRKQKNYGKAPCLISSDPQSSQAKLPTGLFTCPQAKLTPYISIDTPTNTLCIVPSPIVWPIIMEI